MARVLFRNPWFAPSRPRHLNEIQSVSGQRFRKGVCEVPDSLVPFLPTSAKVLDKDEPAEAAPEVEKSLKDFDIGRASAENENDIRNAADATAEAIAEKRRLARLANLAKGRAAKAAKQE